MFLPLASLLVSTLLVADPVSVRAQPTAGGGTVTLDWSSPTTFTTAVDGRELLVQFGRPLELGETPRLEDALKETLSGWIEAVTTGFDTLLIRAARDARFTVTATGPLIVIEMTVAIRTEQAPPSLDDTLAERRLDLLRAQLAMAEGRWTRADRLLATAVEGHPQDREAADLRAQVRADQGGRARVDLVVKDVQHAQTERVSRVSTHGFVGGYLRIGGEFEDDEATRPGSIYRRQRADVYVQQDFDAGGDLRISGFGTRSSLGGGLHYGQPDATGRTQVQVEYRRPFWEFVEGLLGDGTRDRVDIHRDQRFGSRVSGRVTAAFNRYGLGGAADVARSIAFDGGLNVMPRRSNPAVGFEYGLDVESPRGVVAVTLPLVSREVHAGSGTVQARFSRHLSADATAGYVWDRLGGHGPFTTARIRLGGPRRVAFELSYDRRLNSVATGQIVTRTGGFLNWRFD